MAYLTMAALFGLIGVLTVFEMATFSARKERMEQAVDAGDRRGTLVKMFQRSPADYLAALQILNTAATFTVGGMIGPHIEVPIRSFINRQIPQFAYRAELSWTLSIGFITIFALIFTNIVPKHIGFVRANSIALQSAPLMRLWMTISWPVAVLVNMESKAFTKLLKLRPDERYRVTEKDIDVLLAEGVRAGSLDRIEQGVMRRALRLSDTSVASAMLPFERALVLDSALPPTEAFEFLRKHGRSNYPVRAAGSQEIIGVARALDIFARGSVAAALHPAVTVAPDDSLLVALERLRPVETRLLVVEQDGRPVGLLTLNNVLEALVGPIQES